MSTSEMVNLPDDQPAATSPDASAAQRNLQHIQYLLQNLPAPTIVQLYRVLSDGQVAVGRQTEDALQALAGRLPQGLHSLGWYLYWLCNQYATDGYYVLLKRNLLTSPKMIDVWRKSVRVWILDSYKNSIRTEADIRRVDKHRVLQYDWCVRHGLVDDTELILTEDVTRVLSEFLGLPYVRSILHPSTEQHLWTLTMPPCARYSPR